jgi:hypothetical protein
MLRKIKFIFFDILTHTFGNMFILLWPLKTRQLTEQGMTLVLNNNLSIIERLMRKAILKKVEQMKGYDTLEKMHQNYWIKQGAHFFEATNDSFESKFIPDCSFIFELLKKELAKHAEEYITLVEIGTGNGRVLEYLSNEFPKINRFIGIDLSQVQIDINIKKFNQNKKLEFVAFDAFHWIKEYGQENTIFVTSRGVLEYFTEERLQAFLNEINSLGKTIFVAIEPNGIEHNFETNPDSQPYGHERSFSHNYPKLFKNSGFVLWHLSKRTENETTVMSFIGAKN